MCAVEVGSAVKGGKLISSYPMRIAIVSDIHGNLPALEAVVRDIGRRNVDMVVNLGDTLSSPLLPLETTHVRSAALSEVDVRLGHLGIFGDYIVDNRALARIHGLELREAVLAGCGIAIDCS